MTQNLKQNKNKGSSLLNKGASFICCGTPEYTLLVCLDIHDILGFRRGQQSWATDFKKRVRICEF